MSSWIEQLVSSRTTRAVTLAASYAEQRHRVLAENLANIDTPDYHTKVLDPHAFQKSLRDALARPAAGGTDRLELRGAAQVETGPDGRLALNPDREPAPNVLFHDGTNARLERLMTDISENELYYEMATNFVRTRYNNLLSAVRGRVS